MIEPLKTWISLSDNGKPPREDLRIGVFGKGAAYRDEKLNLTAIPTQHCVNSYAFLIEAESKRVLFTGDLRNPSVDFPQIAFETDLDLLVCETAHFSPADCAPVFAKTKTKRILHFHIYDARWAAALQEQLQIPRSYEYGAAFDGLELEI